MEMKRRVGLAFPPIDCKDCEIVRKEDVVTFTEGDKFKEK